MTLDFEKLVEDMIEAAKKQCASRWDVAKPYVEKELNSFVENIKLIAAQKKEEKITEKQAKIYLEIQTASMKTVLSTIQALKKLKVEAVINEALGAIRTVVNTTLGWTIL